MIALERMWTELEADPLQTSEGVLVTRIPLSSPCGLFIGIVMPAKHRLLSVEVPAAAIISGTAWPSAEGFETRVSYDAPRRIATITVTCLNQDSSEVFVAFTDNLMSYMGAATSARACVDALINRIGVWQRFFRRGSAPLESAARIGLFGELHVLQTLVMPSIGLDLAVESWVGPTHERQDFFCPGAAVEVKATRAVLPGSIRVASPQQLDPATAGRLLLCVVFLDVRFDDGVSLTLLINQIRDALRVASTSVASLFEDRLIELGYLDMHESRYSTELFTVRWVRTFEVRESFPSLRESMLPRGVEDVSYSLDLAVCEGFVIENETAAQMIQLKANAH